MHARRVTGDIILNQCFDVFAIEEHVIQFDCSQQHLSANADKTTMGKHTAVNDAAKTLRKSRARSVCVTCSTKICGRPLPRNLTISRILPALRKLCKYGSRSDVMFHDDDVLAA
jgi:hypothetical protein